MANDFWGEWVPYSNEDEKEMAKVYLLSWMFFMLKKFPESKYLSHQIVERNKKDNFLATSTLGIKIQVEKND